MCSHECLCRCRTAFCQDWCGSIDHFHRNANRNKSRDIRSWEESSLDSYSNMTSTQWFFLLLCYLYIFLLPFLMERLALMLVFRYRSSTSLNIKFTPRISLQICSKVCSLRSPLRLCRRLWNFRSSRRAFSWRGQSLRVWIWGWVLWLLFWGL